MRPGANGMLLNTRNCIPLPLQFRLFVCFIYYLNLPVNCSFVISLLYDFLGWIDPFKSVIVQRIHAASRFNRHYKTSTASLVLFPLKRHARVFIHISQILHTATSSTSHSGLFSRSHFRKEDIWIDSCFFFSLFDLHLG